MKQWSLYALNIAMHIVICDLFVLVPITLPLLDLLISIMLYTVHRMGLIRDIEAFDLSQACIA